MSELPPDGSIVAIKSHQYGTYVIACPDCKSVALQNGDNPNKLPKECLWTIHRKLLFDYIKPFESLYFISCYGRYLAVNGYGQTGLCQDVLGTSFSRLVRGTWVYEHVGATHEKVAYGRVVLTVSRAQLCAKNFGQVDLRNSQILLFTKPEVYWTIHCVGSKDTNHHIAPAKPHALCSRLVEDDDDSHKHPCGNVTIINNNNVPTYHHSNIVDSGKNVNHDGNQHIGGVIAGNTYYVTKK